MAGRTKKSEAESKTYMLRIRMTEQDRELLEEAAKTRSLETSTWARSELVALARRLMARQEAGEPEESANRLRGKGVPKA